MAIALFYNGVDLDAMHAALTAVVPTLSGADRTAANRVLTALTNRTTLPVAPTDRWQNDPDTRLLVLSASGTTKQGTIDLFMRIYNRTPAGEFLRAIAKDLRTTCVDPWVG